MIIEYQLTFNSVNQSVQVGDAVYYVPTTLQGGFDQDNGNVIFLGIIMVINEFNIIIAYEDTNGPPLPQVSDFIMFGKNRIANNTSLAGYYAEVNLINNSHERSELFSIGSEVSESSK